MDVANLKHKQKILQVSDLSQDLSLTADVKHLQHILLHDLIY